MISSRAVATILICSLAVSAATIPTQEYEKLAETLIPKEILDQVGKTVSANVKFFGPSDIQEETPESHYDGKDPYEVTYADKAPQPWVEEVQKAKQSLENFVKHLKGFLKTGKFDIVAFEFHQDEILEELSSIGAWIQKMPPSEDLIHQYKFTQYMFSVMSDSILNLKHYQTCDLPGHEWVYNILELNVRLLLMYNELGDLDISLEWYEGLLFGFWLNVHIWGKKFRLVPNVSGDMRYIYDRSSRQAQETLAILGSQLPDMEYSVFRGTG
ncbi:hypothetical protein JCM33374_g2432 [Metschnikowia sp. JCM 33374]|nr:hypothetical protein JCM33374_g2432 [Metschnikowia sp. JCM 33374]